MLTDVGNRGQPHVASEEVEKAGEWIEGSKGKIHCTARKTPAWWEIQRKRCLYSVPMTAIQFTALEGATINSVVYSDI